MPDDFLIFAFRAGFRADDRGETQGSASAGGRPALRKTARCSRSLPAEVDPCGLLKMLNIGHSLHMAIAHGTCNGREAQYTNDTEDFKATLDYIWFSSEALAVLAISQVD